MERVSHRPHHLFPRPGHQLLQFCIHLRCRPYRGNCYPKAVTLRWVLDQPPLQRYLDLSWNRSYFRDTLHWPYSLQIMGHRPAHRHQDPSLLTAFQGRCRPLFLIHSIKALRRRKHLIPDRCLRRCAASIPPYPGSCIGH
jgi:hypothetical protein